MFTSFEQYCREVDHLPRDIENELQIIQRARLGDRSACEQIIAQCLRSVILFAYCYKVYLPHDGYEDIISIGNLALVECLEKALAKDRPIGFLIGCAKIAIKDHVCRYSSLITKNHYNNPVWVIPFDDRLGTIPVHYEQRLTQEDEDLLYRAIGTLTPLQQEIVTANFRLFGHHDDNLNKLHRRNGKKAGQYNNNLQGALKRMRTYILEHSSAENGHTIACLEA